MNRREFDQMGNQKSFRSFSNRDMMDFDELNAEIENELNNEFGINSHLDRENIAGRRHRSNSHSPSRPINATTCQQLANIIGGEVITSTPVCLVQRLRNINATILNRRTRSPLALPFALSFENNQGGRTLNLGETVILQKEINPFMSALRKRGIIVTAVHNHWLFEEPRLMYMHWENVGDPFGFARNSFEAAREVGIF